MFDPAAWTPRLPVADSELGRLPGIGAGVTAAVRDGLGLATVSAKRGAGTALAARILTRYGIALPSGARRELSGAVSFTGIAPSAWLAMSEIGGNALAGGNAFATRLLEELETLAAVADQSDGYLLIRLEGRKTRETLGKLVPLDLHERSFAVSDAASTVAAHIGVTLWRCRDRSDGSPSFELVLFRSMARSFWHALAEAGAEFGFTGGVR